MNSLVNARKTSGKYPLIVQYAHIGTQHTTHQPFVVRRESHSISLFLFLHGRRARRVSLVVYGERYMCGIRLWVALRANREYGIHYSANRNIMSMISSEVDFDSLFIIVFFPFLVSFPICYSQSHSGARNSVGPILVDECRRVARPPFRAVRARRYFISLYYFIVCISFGFERTVQSTHKIHGFGTFTARLERALLPLAMLPKLFIVMLWYNFLRFCSSRFIHWNIHSPHLAMPVRHWRTICAEPIKILRIISRVNSSPSANSFDLILIWLAFGRDSFSLRRQQQRHSKSRKKWRRRNNSNWVSRASSISFAFVSFRFFLSFRSYGQQQSQENNNELKRAAINKQRISSCYRIYVWNRDPHKNM